MSPAVRRAASPTRVVDISLDGVRLPVATARLEALSLSVLRALRVPKAMLSVTFVTSRRMATLNKRHLGHSGPTDVITFALGTDPVNGVTGDIYICPDVARENARARRASVREETARLVVHGILHILGYDHPEDETREESDMWRRQERLLRRIVTTSGRRR